MKNSTDLRIIKTNRAIKEAFLTLLKQKSFDNISVKNLCDMAMISRGTFYLHYQDKYDLADTIENDAIEELEPFLEFITKASLAECIEKKKPLPHLAPLLDYIEEHPVLFSWIASGEKSLSFYGKVSTKFFNRILQIMEISQIDPLVEYKKEMGIAATSYTLNKWIRDGMKDSKEIIADLITYVILMLFAIDKKRLEIQENDFQK